MKVTVDSVVDCLKRHGMGVNNDLNLVSFRGLLVNKEEAVLNDNRIDYFNDTMMVVMPKKGLLYNFRCTAGEPGWYWINHPSYRGPSSGAPFTCPGQYYYVKGIHRGHEAFVQQNSERGRLKVVRDVDQNGKLDRRDLIDRPLHTGINIHAEGSRSQNVGASSSGCHVLYGNWADSWWEQFHALLYHSGLSVFPYTVLEGGWFFDGVPRVLMGSKGSAVKNVQAILEKKGMDLLQDGLFGHETDKRVGRWQAMNGELPTGIVEGRSKWMKENVFS